MAESELERDSRHLLRLLRRARLICTTCASLKLALTEERLVAEAARLVRIRSLEQTVGRCSVCGRTEAVLSKAG